MRLFSLFSVVLFLAAMPRASAKVKARDGADRTYEGVLLSEILKRAGQPRGEELRGRLLSKYVLAIDTAGLVVTLQRPLPDFSLVYCYRLKIPKCGPDCSCPGPLASRRPPYS